MRIMVNVINNRDNRRRLCPLEFGIAYVVFAIESNRWVCNLFVEAGVCNLLVEAGVCNLYVEAEGYATYSWKLRGMQPIRGS